MTLVLRKGLLAVVAASALALAACGGGDKDEQTGATLASVNGAAVKESRVDEQLSQIPAALMQGREADVKRQILDRVIDQELVAQEAKRLKITSDEEYKKQLALVENQLQANFVIAKKVSETLTTEALKQAYEASKANNTFPAVKASHILVPTESEANALLAQVNKDNFAEMAKKFSKGPSAQQGGELGWFRREAMIPEFASVAFNTPVGTVAKTPVKTQFGWHVILVEDRNDKYTPPFEQMEQQLRQEMSQQVVQGYLADLRKNATITYADGVAPAADQTAPAAAPAQQAAPAAAQ
ncbi:MAG: peptidylprolyl isomerase [Blastochloris viridis]|uniref:Parvulin-like PPIase n=1 Tax=Blastochloris viridis TaxID=1079 RepID=A0A6N4R4R0_BLAVI|nr:MAG: peptidylprolyl isomerase [Blastochloris viridis]